MRENFSFYIAVRATFGVTIFTYDSSFIHYAQLFVFTAHRIDSKMAIRSSTRDLSQPSRFRLFPVLD